MPRRLLVIAQEIGHVSQLAQGKGEIKLLSERAPNANTLFGSRSCPFKIEALEGYGQEEQ